MLYRLFFAVFGIALILGGYDMVEVRASLIEFGRAREAVIDMGLFLGAVGFVILVFALTLPLERRS